MSRYDTQLHSAQRSYDHLSPAEDDSQPESERIAEELGLPHWHWLATDIADAMATGDALYLLHQCRKHLAPPMPEAPEPWRDE